MIRELRRFNVRSERGPEFVVVEVATFTRHDDGLEVQNGCGTLLTYQGLEVFATGSPGEFRVGRTGDLVYAVDSFAGT
jgi:hypothetical protein